MVLESDASDSGALARDRRLVDSMWWHRSTLAAALGLDAEQVRAMDARTRRFLVRRRELAVSDTAFGTALAAGALDTARAALARRAGVAAERAVLEELWMLDVLSLLEPAQRERLRAEQPALLRTPWLLRVGGEARRAGRAVQSRTGLHDDPRTRPRTGPQTGPRADTEPVGGSP